MPTPFEPLPPEVQAAVGAGRKVEAIRLLRKATGLSLKEAKDRIEGQPVATNSATTLNPPFPGALPSQVVQALQAGNKIEAIRLLREQSGLGLKEAKEAVEAFEVPGKWAPGEMPRRSSLPWLVAVGVAVALFYFFLR